MGVASYSMLNSLRSAWTSRASWNIFLMFCRTCRQSSRAFDSDSDAFFSRGAGLIDQYRRERSMYDRTVGINQYINHPDWFLHVIFSDEAHQQNVTSKQKRFWTRDSCRLQPETHTHTHSQVLLGSTCPSYQVLLGSVSHQRGSDLMRFLISFSAQVLTIFLGFPLQ